MEGLGLELDTLPEIEFWYTILSNQFIYNFKRKAPTEIYILYYTSLRNFSITNVVSSNYELITHLIFKAIVVGYIGSLNGETH